MSPPIGDGGAASAGAGGFIDERMGCPYHINAIDML